MAIKHQNIEVKIFLFWKSWSRKFWFFNLREEYWGSNASQITWVKQNTHFCWMNYTTKNLIQLHLKF